MTSSARIAIVTGAGGDIGRAAARRLAADGWRLAITEHPGASDALTHTAELLGGVDPWCATFDVTDSDAVADAVRRCREDLGTPTALFNNAGAQGPFAPVPDYPLDAAATVIAVNVLGVLTVLQHVTRAMIEGGRSGAVVNSASMAGVSGAPNMVAYSASKAAVIALTKSAAKDLAPHGIRVNAVSPAFIGPGKMWDNQVAQQAAVGSQYFATTVSEVAAQMISMVPMRRYGSTDEVAAVVSFLLSADASYLTGQNLEITGGSV